ncbi:MAG: hypothetical protein ABJA81_04390 [Nocardioidaceae bacterium]
MKSPLRSIVSRLRAPRHGTIVAYLALALAAAVPASAALSVTSADIVDGQVKRADVGSKAVASDEVVNNSLTGHDIDESKLLLTRISDRIQGGLTVSAPRTPASSPYPLAHNKYTQPRGSSELYLGTFKVTFPSGCDPQPAGTRTAQVEIFVNGKSVGTGFSSDQGTNAKTITAPLLTVGGGFIVGNNAKRSVTAQVQSDCDPATSTASPNVTSVKIDIGRFR